MEAANSIQFGLGNNMASSKLINTCYLASKYSIGSMYMLVLWETNYLFVESNLLNKDNSNTSKNLKEKINNLSANREKLIDVLQTWLHLAANCKHFLLYHFIKLYYK